MLVWRKPLIAVMLGLSAATAVAGVSTLRSGSPGAPAAVNLAEEKGPLHDAMSQLRSAREILDHDKRDLGGHRARAIEAIDAAIDHLKAGIERADRR